jgi:hypothetical protein
MVGSMSERVRAARHARFAPARADRAAYDDAGTLAELFRVARTRAIARGTAELVSLSANASSNQLGRFELWEAVSVNPVSGGNNRSPVSSCKSPTTWTLDPSNQSGNSFNSLFIDAVDMNGLIEQQANIRSAIVYAGAAITQMYLCYTPAGRVYFSAYNGGVPNFNLQVPLTTPVEIDITVYDSTQASNYRGTKRSVLVPGSGMARVVSQ